MIARLWADKIIRGVKTFEEVPTKLRDQVKRILIERGADNFVTEG